MSWLDRIFVAFDGLVDAYGERVNKIEVVRGWPPALAFCPLASASDLFPPFCSPAGRQHVPPVNGASLG